MPWIARDAISQVMVCERPARAEAVTKMMMLPMKIHFRPSRSPNLPPRMVAIVWVSRYAVTTQLMCSAPPRSPTIVGSAVDTMVESSADKSIPPTIRAKATLRAVGPRAGGSSAAERSSTTSA